MNHTSIFSKPILKAIQLYSAIHRQRTSRKSFVSHRMAPTSNIRNNSQNDQRTNFDRRPKLTFGADSSYFITVKQPVIVKLAIFVHTICQNYISQRAATVQEKRLRPIPYYPKCSAARSSSMRMKQRKACRRSTRKRSEERRVGKECRSRWSPYH